MVKTKTIKVTTFTKPAPIEKEEAVIDRDYYNEKIVERALKDKKSVVVQVSGGLVTDVDNLPDGWDWMLLDWDGINEEDEEEYKERLGELIDE